MAALICWMHLVSLHGRNALVLDGGGIYCRVVMFWILFLPLGARWSLDALRTHPKPANGWLDWAGFALLLQIGSVYFFAALLKTGPEWQDGSATYYSLMVDQLVTPLAAWLLARPAPR